ncbi:OmpH family outer membrane protein [Verrucomicrobiales bacterium]|nr:OmpH family outer membrane protein [Verrucomicrobiales bacterium]MDC0292118.1 OmpH family outer membrane protein [Verrucomicrobiales bacterium]
MKLHSFLTLLAGIALTFGFSQNSSAQGYKIAVVDMQEALNNYYKTAIEVEKINGLAKEKRANLDERTADFQALTSKMAELDKIVRDTSRAEASRQESLAEMQRVGQERQTKAKEISDAQRKYQGEVLQARQAMEVALVEEIRSVLNGMATAGGYDLVHDKSFLPKANKAIVFVSANVPDLTAELVATLNKDAPAGAAPAPAAAPATGPAN